MPKRLCRSLISWCGCQNDICSLYGFPPGRYGMSSIPDVSAEVHQRPAPPSDVKRRHEATVIIYHLSATVDFGKHRGSTVESIMRRDPSWLFWAARNLPDFDLSPDAWKKLAEMI